MYDLAPDTDTDLTCPRPGRSAVPYPSAGDWPRARAASRSAGDVTEMELNSHHVQFITARPESRRLAHHGMQSEGDRPAAGAPKWSNGQRGFRREPISGRPATYGPDGRPVGGSRGAVIPATLAVSLRRRRQRRAARRRTSSSDRGRKCGSQSRETRERSAAGGTGGRHSPRCSLRRANRTSGCCLERRLSMTAMFVV